MQYLDFNVSRETNNNKKNIYLSYAEYVRTFLFTSSNSTKLSHLSDSNSKRAKHASGLALPMYLNNIIKSDMVRKNS